MKKQSLPDKQQTSSRKEKTKAVKKTRGPIAAGSQDYWYSLVETASIWIWETDADLRHVYTNAFVRTCLGYKPEEFLKLDTLSLIHPEDRAFVEKLVRDAIASGKGWSEQLIRWRHKDGSWRHIESNGLPLFDAHGEFTGLRGMDRDVTDRKRMEEKLKESEEQLRALSANLADGMVYQVSAGKDGSTRRFTFVSPAVSRFHGLTVEALQKDASLLYNQIVPKDRMLVVEEEARGFARKEKIEVEVRVRMPSGEVRWRRLSSSPRMDAEGNWLWDGIEVDITERKQAEEALRASEQRYRAIVESQTEFVARHLPRGILTFVNDTLCRYANMRKEDLLGLSFYQFIHPEDLPGLIRKIESLTRSNPAVTAESRVILPDGRRAWHRWTHHAIHDETGAFVEYQCTGRDVTEFKLMEQALRESEEKYKFLVEATATGFVILDNKGRVVDANDEYVRLAGHADLNEILGRSVVEWTAAHDQERNAAEVKKCLEQGFVHGLEIDYVHRDGSIIPIEINATVMGMGDAVQIFTLCRDISERKKTEKESSERGALVQQIMDTASAGIALVDMRGRFTHANRRMAELFGCQMDELIDSDYVDHVHPSEREAARKNMFALLESSIPSVDIERYYVKKDGTVFWGHLSCNRFYDVHGNELGLIGVITDITKRKRVEHELLLSRQWLSLHVQQTPLAVVEFDLDGRVRGWNPGAATIFGFSREEAVGQHWHFIVPPEVWGSLNGVWEGLVSQRGGSRSTNRNITKDGRLIDCEWFNTPLIDEDGKTMGVASLVMDATERRKAEEALRESEERFQLAMRGANDGLWDWDLATNEVYYSPRWKSMLGYAPDELEHTIDTWKRLVHPDDRESTLNKVNALIEGSIDKFEVEFRMQHKDGSSRHILSRGFLAKAEGGRHTRLVGTHVDITERRQAEEKLRENQERLDLALRSSQMGVWRWEISENLRYFDDVTCSLLGLDPAIFSGRAEEFFSAVHPEDREKVKTALARALGHNAPYETEYRAVWPDGSIHYLNARGQLVRDALGLPLRINGILWDVTGHKLQEQKLAESEANYRALFEFSTDGIFILDMDGNFIDANRTAYERLGYTREEFFGLNIKRLDHPSFAEKVPERLRQIREKGAAVFESGHLRKDGTMMPVEVNSRLFTYKGRQVYFSVIRDITQRKQSEEKIRRNEEFIRSILDTVDEGFIVIDRDYRILTANKAYCGQAGRACEEIIGRHCYEISHNIARPCYEEGEECAVRHVFETGRPHAALHKHTDPEGNQIFVETKAYPITDELGSIVSVIETINNITERHLLEEERLKTQKLESIGTLAGGIAHDFNNLLQGIFGYISMAKLTLDDREKASAMLGQAEEALHLTVNLTTQLLTFSKGGKPVKKPLSLRPLLESVVKFALSGSHTDFLLESDGDLCPVEADAGQLAQVIQNIVLNANEAMSGRGTVNVTATNALIPAGAYPGLPAGGKFVRIAIRDTGIGIPPQDLHRIFDPYFTTKQRGSGLGLATSYSIIRNHGGVIEVKSEVGRGSTFTIYLPASVEVVAKAERPTPGLPGIKKGRVLLMDDEAMVRDVAKEMIVALGHEAETAADGREAVEMYTKSKESGTPFDLVILDLTVKGGMGGEGAIRRLREIDPGVVAVVSSGYADSPVVAEHSAYGFAAVLNKPYQIDSLRDCLSSLIRKP